MKRLFLGLIVGVLCGVSGCASVTPAPVAGRVGVAVRYTMHNGVPTLTRVNDPAPNPGLDSEIVEDEEGRLIFRPKAETEGDHFWRKNNGWAWGTGVGSLSLLGYAIDKNSGGGSGRLSQVNQERPGACNFAGADNRGATVNCDAHDSHDSFSGP